jgi:hypothetical protein
MRQSAILAAVLAILTVFPAVEGFAAFQAAELIFIPVAARNPGLNNSDWFTDLSITNVDSTAVDISILFMPGGGGSNAAMLARGAAIGGREEEGWGLVVPELADIPPNGTIVLENIIGEYFSEIFETDFLLGGLVIFAYEAGTVDSPEGPVYRNIIAQGRNYTSTTIWVPHEENDGEYVETQTSYGHIVPGVPWYNTADPGDHAITDEHDFSFLVLTGGKENDDYRYNVGLMNCSDSQTQLNLNVTIRGADGEIATNSEGVEAIRLITLLPLAQIQYDQFIKSSMGLGDLDDFSIWIRVLNWTSQAPAGEEKPALTAYGALVNNVSNDPIYVLPSFGDPYPLECVWGAPGVEPAASSVVGSSINISSRSDRRLPIGVPER